MDRKLKLNLNQRCINCGILTTAFERVFKLQPAEQDLLKRWVTFTAVYVSHVMCPQCVALLSAAAAAGGGEAEAEAEGGVAARALGHEAVCLACGRSVLKGVRTVDPNKDPRAYEKIVIWAGHFRGSHMQRVCRTCWRRAMRTVGTLEMTEPANNSGAAPEREDIPEKIDESGLETVSSVTLSRYRRVRATSRRCVFAVQCGAAALRPVPLRLRQAALTAHSLYVPNTARICPEHATEHDWGSLDAHTVPTFSADHVEDMVFLMRNTRPVDFGDIEGMDRYLRREWLGVDWREFNEILYGAPELRRRLGGAAAEALAMHLARGGRGGEVVASAFQVSRAEVEDKLAAVAECLPQTQQEA